MLANLACHPPLPSPEGPVTLLPGCAHRSRSAGMVVARRIAASRGVDAMDAFRGGGSPRHTGTAPAHDSTAHSPPPAHSSAPQFPLTPLPDTNVRNGERARANLLPITKPKQMFRRWVGPAELLARVSSLNSLCC
eukprot:1187368-Prorocentrum_minimum.AAC.2